MSPTEAFVQRLKELQEGERSRLRGLAGQPLDETLAAFDLFTGLWWPLRSKSPRTPRRETSWLVAKLFGAFPLLHAGDDRSYLPGVLGRSQPRDEHDRDRFRRRFDALLQSPLSGLEPHLHWSLSVVAEAVEKGQSPGLNWVRLLDDLSIWDRGEEHRRGPNIRDIWAEEYLKAANQAKGDNPC